MDVLFPVLITVGCVLAAVLIGIFILSLVRKSKGYYTHDHATQSSYDSRKVSIIDKKGEGKTVQTDFAHDREFLISSRIHTEAEDEALLGVVGRDAMKGDIEGPWRSVIASIISANRGVSREHLGFAPVTQVLNEISPTNKNVSIDLDKDELQDFLGYVKVLEASLESKADIKKGITPQQKYRMLQRAFEDKRDLDTTQQARAYSREIIRQHKLHNSQMVAEEQLAKLDRSVGSRVDTLLKERPETQETLDDFKESLKGRKLGRKRRKTVKAQVVA